MPDLTRFQHSREISSRSFPPSQVFFPLQFATVPSSQDHLDLVSKWREETKPPSIWACQLFYISLFCSLLSRSSRRLTPRVTKTHYKKAMALVCTGQDFLHVEDLLANNLPCSYRYRSRNYILLRRCDAEGQSRNSYQRPGKQNNTIICGLHR
jgi:hypothetical protein